MILSFTFITEFCTESLDRSILYIRFNTVAKFNTVACFAETAYHSVIFILKCKLTSNRFLSDLVKI